MSRLTLSKSVACLVVSALPAASCLAAAEFTIDGGTVTEDFTGFTGAGLASPPGMGQLDSSEWTIDGNSSVTDLSRGSSTGGVSTGGVYAFDTDNSSSSTNPALGFQLSGSDFTPGEAVFQIQNASGTTLNYFSLAVDAFVYNDEDRGVQVWIGWSNDGSTVTNIGSAMTVANSELIPTWQSLLSINNNTVMTSVADGDFFYLHLQFDDFNGSGARDEIAFDNISVTGSSMLATVVPTPTASLMAFACFAGVAVRRRRPKLGV